ncbi:MAG: hypothetical protein EXS14_07230 [Planctomycetes bacterium]|nr:hypothetical protein [Planctomycetota bacterium]
MKFRILCAMSLVVCSATGLTAQVTLQSSTLSLGQAYTVAAASGPANGSIYFAIDQHVAPYWIASLGCQIDLALSPKCYVFPKQQLNAAGSITLSLVMSSDPTQVGQYAYLQAVTLDPTSGSARSSNLVTVGVHPAPIATQPVTNLALGNDQVMPTAFSFMSFPFYGSTYSSAHVSSNGRITFTGGVALSVESCVNHLTDEPSIAVLWDDLDPSSGGTVGYSEDPTGAWARITWTNVPQFGVGDSNTASCTLYATGDIALEYGNVALGDCLTGISPGLNASTAVPMDMSACDFRVLQGAIYEIFPLSFDLASSAMTFHPYGGGAYSLLVN